MKKNIFFITLTFSSLAFSQNFSDFKKNLSVEVGGLYLNQNGGDGESYSLLPMVNYKVYDKEKFQLVAQLGATAYKSSDDSGLYAGVLRLNPIYKLGETLFSIEGLIGAQIWSKGDALTLDLGGRINYNSLLLTKDYINEIFLGMGTLNNNNSFTYLTLGLKKSF